MLDFYVYGGIILAVFLVTIFGGFILVLRRVKVTEKSYKEQNVLDNFDSFPVSFARQSNDEEKIMNVINYCKDKGVKYNPDITI